MLKVTYMLQCTGCSIGYPLLGHGIGTKLGSAITAWKAVPLKVFRTPKASELDR